MAVVCFDTHVLIWGVQGQAHDSQRPMIQRTKNFIKYLGQQGDRVIIPTPVLGEFMIGIPDKFHADTINYLQKAFMIVPFDLKASVIFARLWQARTASGVLDELKSEGQTTRRTLKADCLIVSIAQAYDAQCIYSHDPDIRKFADGLISVNEIPDIAMQLDLLP